MHTQQIHIQKNKLKKKHIKKIYSSFSELGYKTLKKFLLCDFIMNPLVCQPDDGPPAGRRTYVSKSEHRAEHFHLVRGISK